MAFPLQRFRNRLGPARIGLLLGAALALAIGGFGAFTGSLGRLTFRRRRQLDAGAASLGEPDGDRLFRRAGAMLAFADVFHRLANEFARLGCRRLAFPFVLAGTFDGLLLGHR